MQSLIGGYNADGVLLEREEYLKWMEEIKSQIMQILKEHNLTIGQADAILSECKGDLSSGVAGMRIREHF
jgi:hypothetical protein